MDHTNPRQTQASKVEHQLVHKLVLNFFACLCLPGIRVFHTHLCPPTLPVKYPGLSPGFQALTCMQHHEGVLLLHHLYLLRLCCTEHPHFSQCSVLHRHQKRLRRWTQQEPLLANSGSLGLCTLRDNLSGHSSCETAKAQLHRQHTVHS